MQKFCFLCDKPFEDQDDVIAIVRAQFKMIPSRVAFALYPPTQVYEIQHYECAKGDIIPDDADIPPEGITA